MHRTPYIGCMNTQQLIDIERLAWLIEADGVAAHNAEIAEVVSIAQQQGLRPSVIAVLADSHAPAAVRERAYGYVAIRLASNTNHLAFAA